MIYIQKNSAEPYYMQIYHQLKEGILSGKIMPNEKLPGIRSLAKTIGVGRNTVDKAYAQLVVEGYLESRAGSGFLVQHIGTEFLYRQSYPEAEKQQFFKNKQNQFRYDFQYGGLPLDQFPIKLWKQYTDDALVSMMAQNNHHHQNTSGDDMLKRELKTYLYRSRGVVCDEEQIIISCGLPYCIEIICNLLKAQVIVYEEPGYPGARDIFIKNNAQIALVTADETGVDLSSLNNLQASAIYVTCSHQFPYGTVLPIQKRRQLLEWASWRDAFVIEDDYDSEFRYDANPVPSLQAIDKDDRVIYIGTFSKALSPSMRVNFMVLPKRLLYSYQERYQGYPCPVSWITQRILANFIAHGDYERHIRRMTLICKKKHDHFIRIADQWLGEKIKVYGKGSGLHFFIEIDDNRKTEELIGLASKNEVGIYAAESFWYDKSRKKKQVLFLGYANLTEAEIEEGIIRLYNAWFAV